jgi:hypothetical protein
MIIWQQLSFIKIIKVKAETNILTYYEKESKETCSADLVC